MSVHVCMCVLLTLSLSSLPCVRQGRELRGDSDDAMMADHVLVQGQNLVLQRVTRHAQGRYQCRVTNTIDTVTSSATTLNVMCKATV